MSHRISPPMLLSVLVALSPFIAMAQASPESDASAITPFTIAVPVDNLPTPEAEVWLVRYILEPGGSIPQLNQPGPTLAVVEQGDITLITDKPVKLKNTLYLSPPSSVDRPKGATMLGEGEGALIPAETRLGITNTSDLQSRVLVLKVFSPEQKRRANIPTGIPTYMPSDVIVQPVSHGLVSFNDGAGVLVMERRVINPGRSTVGGVFNGVVIGALERGEARATFLDGSNWMWPNILTDYEKSAIGGPVPLNPGAIIDLSTGDGFTSKNGYLTLRSTGEEPLVIVRAVASAIGS